MKTKVIKEIVIDGLFLALVAIFTYIPYIGIITIGTLSFTTLHILVLIAASLYGVKTGTLVGLFFGIFSLLKAIQYPGTLDYFFINPFVSILPRVLFGFISGLIFDISKKKLSNKAFKIAVAPLAAILTFIHTLLVLLCLYIFGIEDIFKISQGLGLSSIIDSYSNYEFLYFVLAFVSIGSVVEIIGAAIITPICYGALGNVVQTNNNINTNIELNEEIPLEEENKTAK